MRKAIAGVLVLVGLVAFVPESAHAITGVLCIKATGKGAVKVRNPTCKASEVQIGSFDTATPQASLTDVSVRLESTTNSVPSVVGLYCPFGAGSEIYDTNNLHDEVTNPTRLTAPVAGKYYIHADVGWQSSAAGTYRIALLRVNNLLPYVSYSFVSPVGGGENTTNNLSTQVSLAAGDYVELFVNQDSGGPLLTTINFGMLKAP